MSESVDINYLKNTYRNSRIRYVIQEVKKVIKGQLEEKTICVKGEKKDIEELIWRLKLSLKKVGGELIFADQSTDTSKRAVYVFYTSKITQDSKIPSKNAVVIIEDSRGFIGECERVEIK